MCNGLYAIVRLI